MYLACRHIKPNGVRCESPALCGHAFCYFHARVHTKSNITALSDLKLPVPEDNAAIQESLARVFEAILNSRINSKEAAQILWGLQIASQTIPRKSRPDPPSIESVTQSEEGDDLAPAKSVCESYDDCSECSYADDCPDYHPDDEDDDEDDEDDEDSGADEN